MSTTLTLTPPGQHLARWRQILGTAFNGLRQTTAPPTEDPRLRAAAAVRELAFSYRQSDPGFASDLYAAADRYEWSLEAQPGDAPR
jgi:hypothetical protein